MLLRVDSAGATHELIEWCREARIGFSVGYDLTESVRSAILKLPEDAWVAAQDADGRPRENGQVAELTDRLDLSAWPERSRVIVRRERPHPGAQLRFSDHDGHRFQAILCDQPDPDIAAIEREHRQRARCEDHIRNDKDTGLRNLPFRDFEHNRVWLALVLIAHDLIAWTQRLLLTGELARCEPKRLRHRLLHVAARLAFHARTAKAAPASVLALGRRPRRRVRTPQRAPRTRRLTRPRGCTELQHTAGGHAPRVACPHASAYPSQCRRPALGHRLTAPTTTISTVPHPDKRRSVTSPGLLHDPG